jgi:capsular polysaccharide biosynthesis protein
VSWNGIVMKGLEVFKPSLPYPEAWTEFSGTYLLRQWIASAEHPVISGSRRVALVHDFWSVNNYYHWLADVLPRLLILQQLHPDCVLLLPEGASSYMLLSAQALGFTIFHFTPKNRVVRSIDIIMPSHTAAIGRQDKLLLHQVRQQLLNAFASPASTLEPKRRIFVSRRTQHTRRLLNEEELAPLLAQYEIEIVLFDGMTLPQQVKMMQSVDLFIGVHGANMTNLVFLLPNTPVIELMDAKHPNLCYFNMAANLSLPYQVVPCEGDAEISVHENNYNLQVSLSALEQAVLYSIS